MHSLDLQMFDAFLGFGAAGEQGIDGVMVNHAVPLNSAHSVVPNPPQSATTRGVVLYKYSY